MYRVSSSRFFWGLLLMALGGVWLLNNVNVTSLDMGD
ncbi:MAG: hypothetical protein K0R39_4055, partial [Symbiobacteriaceae bacterium]|nr:hypothetical protein [Symbiobacteriaceae bacterium]